MDVDELVHRLDHPEDLAWLSEWGIAQPARAHDNLVRVASTSMTLDLLADACNQLAEHLPNCSDPDMALNNLERFIAASRNPLSLGSLFERDREALPTLIRIFSVSQYFGDLLISDAGAYELLRLTQGQAVSRESLIQELVTEITALSTLAGVSAALRRFKRRETLRIGYGDVIREQRLEMVIAQISHLADALVESALRAVRLELEQQHGVPETPDGKPARYAVLALGKLGGSELNYSSDIDLIFLYDGEGTLSKNPRMTNGEYFAK
ncbi:MAG: hypothetical protein N2C14_25300, partial [Planctomycetales bacterium]